MKISIEDIINFDLDMGVALARGGLFDAYRPLTERQMIIPGFGLKLAKKTTNSINEFSPSTNWSQGGLIIERYKLDVENGDLEQAMIDLVNYKFEYIDTLDLEKYRSPIEYQKIMIDNT